MLKRDTFQPSLNSVVFKLHVLGDMEADTVGKCSCASPMAGGLGRRAHRQSCTLLTKGIKYFLPLMTSAPSPAEQLNCSASANDQLNTAKFIHYSCYHFGRLKYVSHIKLQLQMAQLLLRNCSV